MKTIARMTQVSLVTISISSLIMLSSCASQQVASDEQKREAQMQAQVNSPPPPVVINPRAEPSEVQLTKDLSANQAVNVYADIKSFKSDIDRVQLRLTFAPETERQLRFFKNPVEINMKHLDGTTWGAKLTEHELKQLAISGESLTYQGFVLAQNDEGQISVSTKPVQITIQASAIEQRKG